MKISFLFMIYDKIEKEDLWYEFFRNEDINKYTIYIHAKNNSNVIFTNDFFYKYLLPTNYPTEWGTYSLINVQNRLLEASLHDKENRKFIFVSGSHIPLHNFNFLYNYLSKNDNSYFHYFEVKKDSNLFNRLSSINNIHKYNLISWVYGSQWSILNRAHAEFIIKNEKDFELIFSKSKIPDEFAYINYLFENKMQKIINIKTTYFSFVPSYNKKYRPIPHTYDTNELNLNNIRKIKERFLFMRKVVNSCIVKPEWIFYNINNFRLNNNIKIADRTIFSKIKKIEINNKLKIN